MNFRRPTTFMNSTFLPAALIGLSLCVSAADFSISWFTIDGGGNTSTGGVYSVSCTIGQPDAGGATAGVSLAPGGTAWAMISDRNVKKDFTPLDSRKVLEKLAALSI